MKNLLVRCLTITLFICMIDIKVSVGAELSPILGWSPKLGYVKDGVYPDNGTLSTIFTYRVNYISPANCPPKPDYPKLRIYKAGSEIPGSPFTMLADDPNDTTYTDGKFYYYQTALPTAGAKYTYKFEATDQADREGIGAPIYSQRGPTVATNTITIEL